VTTDSNEDGTQDAGDVNEDVATADAAERTTGLSYKFQRLREKLREAILSGEFTGKLPGERQLAKRFHVNAKTLSKALTDLAAEGLLDRSIGRGTYVKGSAPAPTAEGRWLILAEPSAVDSPVARQLQAANPNVTFCTDFGQIRPSFLAGFVAVIDLGGVATESVLRDLVVRALPVVTIGAEPRTYSMHCVTPDLALAAMKVGRDLLLAGHRRLVAVEATGRTALTQTLRQAATRYAPDSVVDTCSPGEVATLLGDGAVAFVCESLPAAAMARAAINQSGTGDIALAAVGIAEEDAPCSGYFASPKLVVDAAVSLLRDPPARPAIIWLTAQWIDRATLPASDTEIGESASSGLSQLRLTSHPGVATLPA
jgi:hypothetical protein